MRQPDLFDQPSAGSPADRMIARGPIREGRWHMAIYRGAICWIGLAQLWPFRGRERLLCPRTGRFAFGETREEALSNLREAVAA